MIFDRDADGKPIIPQTEEDWNKVRVTYVYQYSTKKDGKGDPYLDRWYNHMPLLDAMQTASRKAFKRAFVGQYPFECANYLFLIIFEIHFNRSVIQAY